MQEKLSRAQLEQRLKEFERKTSELELAEKRQALAIRLLELINQGSKRIDLIREILTQIKEFTGIEAVGIRLREEEEFPYYQANGFSSDFVRKEQSLCANDQDGNILRDLDGRPVLECMCGNIIRGRTNPALPFFTEGGSFWTNCTTELLASTMEEDRLTPTRNRCNGEGYESVALIPLRSGKEVIGLLQLNDRRRGVFESEELIRFFEGIGASIGVSFSRNLAEDKLRENEEKHRNLVELSPDPIAIIQGNYYLWVSAGFTRVFGYTQEDIEHGLNVLDLVPEDERETVRQRYGRRLKGVPTTKNINIDLINKEGEVIPCETSGSLINYNGQPAIMAIIRDISDRRRREIEREKIQANRQEVSKLEAITALAGGIAHDFNNLLASISGNIELLELMLNGDEFTNKRLESMKRSSHRMAVLTNQLMAYARGGKYQPEKISLSAFVKNTISVIMPKIGPAVTFETDLAGDISPVRADSIQMQMVLSGILINASEALEGNGKIRISMGEEEIDEISAKSKPELKAGPYVCLSIEDNGVGMDGETKSRVFEPFFSTKFLGRGLGMAAAHGIVKNHNGSISVDSELGKGTVVRIYLPAVGTGES